MTAVDEPTSTDNAASQAPPRHSLVEDVAGVLTGTYLASLGIFLIHAGKAVTGGTAGLSLLLSYATSLDFSPIFVIVNLPFLALGYLKRGLGFTLRTLACILLVSAWAYLHPLTIHIDAIDPLYGTLTGNLLLGVAMLILFRHNASLGGLNTVALLAQDHLKLPAGAVQLGLDFIVIASSLSIAAISTVAISVLGAAILNIVLIMNHKPGQYIAG